MDKDEIARKLFSDPDKFFKEMEAKNFDFRVFKKNDIPKLFVHKRYKDLIKQEHFDAAESVLWISYFAEREIREAIFDVETKIGKNPDEIDKELDKMTFGQKINFIENNYNPEGKSSAFIEVLRSIKTLRNHMAHGRLNKLTYGQYSLADPRGQIKLIIDLMNAALNKKI
jgi:hypothetical protein